MMLIHFSRHLALAMGAFVLLAGSASAQFNPPVLRNRSLQRELKITPTQNKRIEAFIKEFEERQRKSVQGFANASPEEKRRLSDEFATWSSEQFERVLKPEQLKRLKEIVIQGAGFRAMYHPKIQGDLKFTRAQQEKIVALMDQGESELREKTTKTGQVARPRQDIDKETYAKILAQLSPEQKRLWADMNGAPFAMKPDEGEPKARPDRRRPEGEPLKKR